MSLPRGPFGPSLLCLLFACTGSARALPVAGTVFINEFHYDNAGADSGEFIELAGPTGSDLSGWSLLLYNGSNGLDYASFDLSGVFGDDAGSGFGFRLVDLAGVSLQNGAPDGMALLDGGGTVQEFLSYEGVLTALGGPLAGLSSVDIGVSESSSTPLGASLQRVGQGSLGSDFAWESALQASPGQLNPGQRLLAAAGAPAAATVLSAGPPWPLWLVALLWLVRRRLVAPG